MLHLPHVSGRLIGTPLMVHGHKLKAIMAGLAPRLGLRPAAFEDDYDERPRPARRPYVVTDAGIAIVPVVGLLANRAGGVDASSTPMASYESVVALTRTALADPAVRGVVQDYETPGGEAFGCFDASKALAAMRGGKPIVAVANAYSYSAGYALMSAADMIFVPQSGEVGSIGVVAVHVDESGADAQDGLAWEYIYQGDHKVDGHPHAPLSDTARAGIERQVAHLYDLFVNGVAENRRIDAAKVRATEAACLNAEEAIEAGLADRIGTLSDAVAECARLADARTPPRGAAPARGRSTAQSTTGGTAVSDRNDVAAGDTAPNAQHTPEELAAATAAARVAAAEEAAGIVELCTMAGRPQDAAEHIKAGRSRGDVAMALLKAKADAGAQDTTMTAHAAQGGAHDTSAAVDVDKSWAHSISRVCGAVKGA
jgi:ClpP class serine protease